MTTKAEKAARSLAHDILLADMESGNVEERLAERRQHRLTVLFVAEALAAFNEIIKSLEDKP